MHCNPQSTGSSIYTHSAVLSLSSANIQKDSWMWSSGGPQCLPEILGSKEKSKKWN